MTALDKLSLGEFYRELRLARKVKQKDVAKGRLTASQLSKFEQGQSMLSADRLFQAIEGINMTFSEFGHALNNYQDSPFLLLGNQIGECYFARDVDGLEQLLRGLGRSSLHDNLMAIVIKCAIYTLDDCRKVPPNDVAILTDYLYAVEQWTAFELYLLTNTLCILDETDIIFLGKFLIGRSQFYQSLQTNKRLFKYLLLNIISTLLERQSPALFEFFASHLKNQLDYEDILISVMLDFLEQCYQCFCLKASDLDSIRSYIQDLSILKNEDLLAILRLKLEQFQRIYAD